MSGRFSSAVIFVSLIVIAMAAGQAEDNTRPIRVTAKVVPVRELASVDKEMRLATDSLAPAVKHTEKARGSIAVKIQLVGSRPSKAGDVFVLRGVISSDSESLNDLGFKWSLPKGVRLVNGELNGLVGAIAAGETRAVELTLEKTSTENEQVHLLAGARSGSSHYADVAQYNTDKQESMDDVESVTKQARKVQGADPKIIH